MCHDGEVDDDQTSMNASATLAVRARAAGSVVAAAAGDALGAPYEFQAPISGSEEIGMIGGGVLGWAEAEWTDDTAMAIVVLEAAAAAPEDHDLRACSALDQIAREWYSWSMGTPDIGALTSHVIRRAAESARADGRSVPRASDFQRAASEVHRDLPRVSGNGALMRTHAAAIAALLQSDDVAQETIEAVCGLTHAHPDASEACLLWGFAVRHAVLTGEIDVRRALPRLGAERRGLWERRIEEAEASEPASFPRNGWVVHAFQAALAAVHGVGAIPAGKFAQRAALVQALESAVRAGNDTDTVACIAGSLMGGALGFKAVPPEWRREMFGWPGYGVKELVALVESLVPVPAEGLA